MSGKAGPENVLPSRVGRVGCLAEVALARTLALGTTFYKAVHNVTWAV